MNIFTQFFQAILFQPFLNALVLLYVYLPGNDFGIAVIILTLIIKFVLHPLTAKGLKSQKVAAELQPKLNEIKEKHKNDKAAQSRAMMELYQKEKVNPMSGCLPLLIQLPIIIALYRVFQGVFKSETLQANLYGFVQNPGVVDPTFLGLSLLNNQLFVGILAVLAGIAQFFQMKMTKTKKEAKNKGRQKDFAASMQTQMLYVFPIISVVLVYKLGAVIGLYWLVTILFSVGEQYFINRGQTSKKLERQKGEV